MALAMELSVQETTWQQMDALLLENDSLRTVVVPEMGAKLVSLFDKRVQVEWLAGPGDRPFRPVSYGSPFTEQDMSGWDEMFPTISACVYPGPGEKRGVPLPDHGEVWALPWERAPGRADQIALTVAGKALPYRLARTLQFSAPDSLALHYSLVNEGEEILPYIWAAHPQFTCPQPAQILLPPSINRVCNTLPEAWGWGPPETVYEWPEAVDRRGKAVRLDRVGPPTRGQARKFFALPGAQVEWVALVCGPAGHWLRMAWSPAEVPYFGLWVDEGALSPSAVATPEPTSGFYDSLALAWENKLVTTAAPGTTRSWTLTVQLGTGGGPIRKK